MSACTERLTRSEPAGTLRREYDALGEPVFQHRRISPHSSQAARGPPTPKQG